MTIIGMHIRHNWPEWVTWTEQKTVKSVCNVRTTPKMSGIPGVTEQPPIIVERGVPKLGWCIRCTRATFRHLSPEGLTIDGAPQCILDLHEKARAELAPVLIAENLHAARVYRHNPDHQQRCFDRANELGLEFPDALSTLRAVGFDI